MSGTITGTTYSKNQFHYFFGRPYLWVIFIFFLFFSSWGVKGQNGVTISSASLPGPTQDNPIIIDIHFNDGVDDLELGDLTVINGIIQNLVRHDPDFINSGSEDIDDFLVTATVGEILANRNNLGPYLSEKVKDAIVAIDINSNDEIFYLTFNNGVFKFNPTGNDLLIISPDEFSSPMDMAIDNNDRILVADTDEFKVRVYRDNIHLYDIGGFQGADGNEFYGPMGLAIGPGNSLYVVDSYPGEYSGTEPGSEKVKDKVKIYSINESAATYLRGYGENILDDPYRIAVDKDNKVYVSDAGGANGTGRVVVFNSTDAFQTIILNSLAHSPGSLITDSYGYLYVINYRGDLNFTDIYQDPVNLFTRYNTISTRNYDVDVFDPANNFQKVATIKENLNLPVDLALNSCGYLFVNDLNLGGSASFRLVNATFNFDIQNYRREDNFNASLIPSSSGVVEVKIENKILFKCGPQPSGEFSIIYQPDDPDPLFECKDTFSIQLDANGEAILLAEDLYTGDGTGTQFNLSKSSFTCDDLGVQTITLSYTGAETGICFLDVTVEDILNPTITCPGNISENADSNGSFTLLDYTGNATATDNCGTPRITQDPPVGTIIKKDTVITLSATDDEGYTDFCSFMVNLIATTDPDPDNLKIQCPGDHTMPLNEECAFQIQDYTDSALANKPATITQEPPVGTWVSKTTLVTFTATTETGETAVCTMLITLTDETDPIIIACPESDVLENYDPVTGFTLPDYIEKFEYSDSCTAPENMLIEQTPAVGTLIFTDTPISITIRDEAGNVAECNFRVVLTEEVLLEITCLENQVAQPNESGEFILPNYANMASATLDAEISQSPLAGTVITSGREITLTATSGGESVSCIFNVSFPGNTPPLAQNNFYETPQNTSLVIAAADGVLNNDTDEDGDELTAVLLAGVSNGQLDFNEDGSFTYTPNSGYFGTDSFVYEARDGESASGSTSVYITVISPGNNPPVAVDDFYEVNKGEVLEVGVVGGVLQNDVDRDGDSISTRFITPISSGSITFNMDGSFTFIPASNFTGLVTFQYVAFDGELESTPATVTITVMDNEDPGGDFRCLAKIVVALDENGLVVISPSQLYNGNPGTRAFELSQETFTCEDIGQNNISLSWTGESNGSCVVIVEVRDNTSPVLRTNNLTVGLNENGRVTVAPELLNNGSYDNCGITQFSLDRTEFSCKDLGPNEVRFTATDPSGNNTSQTVTITVTGSCDGVVPGGEETNYIIIYPNPTTGPINIATPEGDIITRIEVFDFRGRFILAKDFPENADSYSMDLTGVQHAVYVLKIITSERNIIRRVIVY